MNWSRLGASLKGAFMIGPFLVAAALCAPGPAAAQTCYIAGHLSFDSPWEAGFDYIVSVGEVEVSTTDPSGWDAEAQFTCGPSMAGRVRAIVLGPVSYITCWQGTQEGNWCKGDSSPVPNAYTFAEAEGYKQEGFYGLWDIKGEYYYWRGSSVQTMQLFGPTFTITKGRDYGYPSNPEQECIDGGGTWDPYEQLCFYSPIVISLKGQRFKFSSVDEGVLFDMDGDGTLEQVSWSLRDEELAFLALDRNGNGTIDNGTELLGDKTLPDAGDGFTALNKLAEQMGGRRGTIEAGHELFDKLLLWVDRNHDGVSQAGELRPFGDLFVGLRLGFTGHHRRDGHGNQFRYLGSVLAKGSKPLRDFRFEDYKAHEKVIYDVFLVGRKLH